MSLSPSTKFARPVSEKKMLQSRGFKRFLAHILRQEFFRLKVTLLYFLRRRPQQKFCFILCPHRSGSNLLTQYLNCHPSVHLGGEILSNTQKQGLRIKFLSKRSALFYLRCYANYFNYPICGAKLTFFHLQMRGISSQELHKEFPNAKWLILYRKNLLDQYISLKIALKTGQWFSKHTGAHPKLEDIRFKLNFNAFLEYRDWNIAACREILNTPAMAQRTLWITYEELTEKPQKIFKDLIFPYLGLKRLPPVSTKLRKQNIWQYHEILSNYHEVKDLIETTNLTQSYPQEDLKNKP